MSKRKRKVWTTLSGSHVLGDVRTASFSDEAMASHLEEAARQGLEVTGTRQEVSPDGKMMLTVSEVCPNVCLS
jgi:hypothetical protein